MREKIRTDLKGASKFYDDVIFKDQGYENPEHFKKKVMNIILSHKKNGNLLDVACGNGNFTQHMQDKFNTYGMDFSKNAIEIAKKRCKGVFKVAPAEKLPFGNKEFDVVTCLGSFEHFVDMDKSLKEMKRVMKDDAIAIIHVPNSEYLVHKVLGIDTHGQINERFATEKEWKNIIGKELRVVKTYRYNTRWYLKWIPTRWCCHFTFLCRK